MNVDFLLCRLLGPRLDLLKKIMTKANAVNRREAIQFAVILTLVATCSFAQNSSEHATNRFSLEQLKGYSSTIYYSPGHASRAKDIALFMEGATHFFQEQLHFTPQTKMYILAPQHWKEFASKTLHDVYGFPHNIDHERLVVASEDNDFWRSFLPPADQLPQPLAAQITKAYRKPDGSYSMMPFFDLLALHELGHSYTAQAGLKMHRHWMSELFVNIMLHTYIAEKKSELLPALEAFPNMVVSGGTAAYKFTSLEDFEKLYATMGMGPRNYGWYQCKLHSAAKNIYNAGGRSVLIKLWAALKKYQQEMTDSELVDMLKSEVHPSVADVYLNWN